MHEVLRGERVTGCRCFLKVETKSDDSCASTAASAHSHVLLVGQLTSTEPMPSYEDKYDKCKVAFQLRPREIQGEEKAGAEVFAKSRSGRLKVATLPGANAVNPILIFGHGGGGACCLGAGGGGDNATAVVKLALRRTQCSGGSNEVAVSCFVTRQPLELTSIGAIRRSLAQPKQRSINLPGSSTAP